RHPVCLYSEDRRFFLCCELYHALASAIGEGKRAFASSFPRASRLNRCRSPLQAQIARLDLIRSRDDVKLVGEPLMAINIAAWSIRQPLPALVGAAVVTLLGCIAFAKLPITRMPNVDVPIISVTITQFGAAPSELESQVTKPVEDAVSGVEGVRHIESAITDGVSSTTIEFRLDTDTDRALNDIKDAVTRVRGNLPSGIDEPLTQRVDISGMPILTYVAISPGKTPEQLSYFVDDVVSRALQGVRGVGGVQRIGGVDRDIRVGLDPDRLQAVGLTALEVSRRLRGTVVDVAGGRTEIGGRDQSIRTLAGAATLAELSAMRIALPLESEGRLDDL